jgi:chloramphenicol 3-O phosphotransferase
MDGGRIIFINGVSSSGITSTVHALQDFLDEPYLEARIDKFIFTMPVRQLERPLWDDVLGLAGEAGMTGHTLIRGMHRAIKVLSKAGVNVIVDHVLVESAWAKDCAILFAEMPAYLIGIKCPLDVLEEREHSRKNRTLGQAKLQFPIIHKFVENDLDVDTSILSPEECAIHIRSRLVEPSHAFGKMRQMI